MNVTGKTKVYARTFSNGQTAYSRRISFKDKQGTWWNMYEPLTFKGGDPGLETKSYINVQTAFESGYLDAQGQPCRKLVIMDWEKAEDPSEPGDFAALNEDIPF